MDRDGAGVRCDAAGLGNTGPQPSQGAQLGDLHKEITSHRQNEPQAAADDLGRDAGGLEPAQVLDAGGDCQGELVDRGRPALGMGKGGYGDGANLRRVLLGPSDHARHQGEAGLEAPRQGAVGGQSAERVVVEGAPKAAGRKAETPFRRRHQRGQGRGGAAAVEIDRRVAHNLEQPGHRPDRQPPPCALPPVDLGPQRAPAARQPLDSLVDRRLGFSEIDGKAGLPGVARRSFDRDPIERKILHRIQRRDLETLVGGASQRLQRPRTERPASQVFPVREERTWKVLGNLQLAVEYRVVIAFRGHGTSRGSPFESRIILTRPAMLVPGRPETSARFLRTTVS